MDVQAANALARLGGRLESYRADVRAGEQRLEHAKHQNQHYPGQNQNQSHQHHQHQQKQQQQQQSMGDGSSGYATPNTASRVVYRTPGGVHRTPSGGGIVTPVYDRYGRVSYVKTPGSLRKGSGPLDHYSQQQQQQQQQGQKNGGGGEYATPQSLAAHHRVVPRSASNPFDGAAAASPFLGGSVMVAGGFAPHGAGYVAEPLTSSSQGSSQGGLPYPYAGGYQQHVQQPVQQEFRARQKLFDGGENTANPTPSKQQPPVAKPEVLGDSAVKSSNVGPGETGASKPQAKQEEKKVKKQITESAKKRQPSSGQPLVEQLLRTGLGATDNNSPLGMRAGAAVRGMATEETTPRCGGDNETISSLDIPSEDLAQDTESLLSSPLSDGQGGSARGASPPKTARGNTTTKQSPTGGADESVELKARIAAIKTPRATPSNRERRRQQEATRRAHEADLEIQRQRERCAKLEARVSQLTQQVQSAREQRDADASLLAAAKAEGQRATLEARRAKESLRELAEKGDAAAEVDTAVRAAEADIEVAESKAAEADARAAESAARAASLEAKLEESGKEHAEKLAEVVHDKAAAEARAKDAEAKAKSAEAKAKDAEAKAKDAEAKAKDAEAKAKSAKAMAAAAAAHSRNLPESERAPEPGTAKAKRLAAELEAMRKARDEAVEKLETVSDKLKRVQAARAREHSEAGHIDGLKAENERLLAQCDELRAASEREASARGDAVAEAEEAKRVAAARLATIQGLGTAAEGSARQVEMMRAKLAELEAAVRAERAMKRAGGGAAGSGPVDTLVAAVMRDAVAAGDEATAAAVNGSPANSSSSSSSSSAVSAEASRVAALEAENAKLRARMRNAVMDAEEQVLALREELSAHEVGAAAAAARAEADAQAGAAASGLDNVRVRQLRRQLADAKRGAVDLKNENAALRAREQALQEQVQNGSGSRQGPAPSSARGPLAAEMGLRRKLKAAAEEVRELKAKLVDVEAHASSADAEVVEKNRLLGSMRRELKAAKAAKATATSAAAKNADDGEDVDLDALREEMSETHRTFLNTKVKLASLAESPRHSGSRQVKMPLSARHHPRTPMYPGRVQEPLTSRKGNSSKTPAKPIFK